jgi:ABC-type ATPase involved in cell division
MSDQAIAVHVDGVSKRFSHRVKGEVYAARDVRLAVAPGEFLTLLGPSGCGKTTTLRMIAGFEMPDEGRIRFGEQDVTTLPANQRNIGFVFQNYALFPHLSVTENVAYGLHVRALSAAEIAERVSEVLKLVGLAGYEHQFSSQLSGGEQQRVALARAIVIRPARALVRRAAFEPRREAARADAHGDPRPAAPARDNHRLRHARPGRGDGRVRSHRRDEPGQRRAGRNRRRTSTTARAASSSRRSSAA